MTITTDPVPREPVGEPMPAPSQIVEDAEAVAKKERINVVLEDNPERWMITVTKVPVETNVGIDTQTIIIETEPSLWFRTEKLWQEFTDDGTPVYKMVVILDTHFIGR